MKLKEKVNDINYVFEKKPMIVYHVNAILRYGGRLDEGLFSITINRNYINEKKVLDL